MDILRVVLIAFIYFILYIVGLYFLDRVRHKDGSLIITDKGDNKELWTFELTTPVESIYKKQTIYVKVERRQDGNGGTQT